MVIAAEAVVAVETTKARAKAKPRRNFDFNKFKNQKILISKYNNDLVNLGVAKTDFRAPKYTSSIDVTADANYAEGQRIKNMVMGNQILKRQGVATHKRWLPLIPGLIGSLMVGLAWWPGIFGL